MLISQYAYFSVESVSMTAEEITAHLGVDPDEVTVRGSRVSDPPRPVRHSWKIVCRDRHSTVDQQLGRILDRLSPVAGELGKLAAVLAEVDGDQGGCTLQVVRSFNDPDGEDEDFSSPVDHFEKLAGQHQLLGWHLDRRVLDFLLVTGANLDMDEYG